MDDPAAPQRSRNPAETPAPASPPGHAGGKHLRTLFIALALLVVFLSVWPIYVGTRIEHRLHQPQEGVWQDWQFRYTSTGYTRGWYRSVATGTLVLDRQGHSLVIPWVHAIRHRVLGAELLSYVDLSAMPPTAHRWLGDLLRQASLRADTWVGLRSGVTARLETRPMALDASAPTHGPLQLAIGAAKGNLVLSRERQIFSLEAESLTLQQGDRRLEFTQPQQRLLRVPGVSSGTGPEATPRTADFDWWLGFANGTLQWRDQAPWTLQQFTLHAVHNASPERLDHRLQIRALQLEGSHLTIAPVDLLFQAVRWPWPILSELWQQLAEWQRTDTDERMAPALVLPSFLAAIQQIVAYSPVLQIQIDLNEAPTEHVRFHFELSFPGLTEPVQTSALRALSVQAELAVGRALLQQGATLHPTMPPTQNPPLNPPLNPPQALGQDLGQDLGQEREVDPVLTRPQQMSILLQQGAEQGWWRLDEQRLHAELHLREGRIWLNAQDFTGPFLMLMLAFLLNPS